MCTGASIAIIAQVVAAAAATATSVYSATKGTPTLPTPKAPSVPPPMVPPIPPAFKEVAGVEEADAKARQAAARKQRDLESRSSNASSILTTPLGVSTPAGNVKSTVLGR